MTVNLMYALLASARVAAAAGDAGRASDDAHEALTMARAGEYQTGIADALEILGALAPGAEDHHKATRLLGAADAIRQETGYQRFRLHQHGYDATVQALRTAVGDAAFGHAWDEGAALTLDEIVSYALRGRGERSRPAIGWLSLTPLSETSPASWAKDSPIGTSPPGSSCHHVPSKRTSPTCTASSASPPECNSLRKSRATCEVRIDLERHIRYFRNDGHRTRGELAPP